MTDKAPICYLIGSMEHAKDGGYSSFDKRARLLAEMGHEYINPVEHEKEKTGYTAADAQGEINKVRVSGNIEKFMEIYNAIWKFDLMAIKQADYLWLHLEPEDKVGGTVLEQTMANACALIGLLQGQLDERDKELAQIVKMLMARFGFGKKPIYLTCFGGYTKLNGTMEFLVRKSGGEIFSTWKDTTKFLKDRYGVFKNEQSTEVKKD